MPNKPIAAPRSINCDTLKKPDVMSKSLSSMDAESDCVQIRRQVCETAAEKPAKPMVPVRPASLKALPRSIDSLADPMLQRTQCSVYSVANKQQPSYVNIQNR